MYSLESSRVDVALDDASLHSKNTILNSMIRLGFLHHVPKEVQLPFSKLVFRWLMKHSGDRGLDR